MNRKAWIDKAGNYCSIRGKTCLDCPAYYTTTRLVNGAHRVYAKCTLTNGYVNMYQTACILFPTQMGWRPVYV